MKHEPNTDDLPKHGDQSDPSLPKAKNPPRPETPKPTPLVEVSQPDVAPSPSPTVSDTTAKAPVKGK